MAEWDAYVAEHGRRTKGEASATARRRNPPENSGPRPPNALHHGNQALREHIDSDLLTATYTPTITVSGG